ncbi:hypothetical protein GCM10010156_68140 [Planobispora rosea]|uniref:Uncharacterized protein n=1 Tax=Planobispora rosea TaxID=35762 RepID=A0A8J3WFI3_PLARO|nr:hypothetical protein [Planobispora rosea]GGT00433.1 hypothetical protein GCM10010156_68140 [Planobispora rosea]GIH88204.1 hypothetical protein Pro02_66120 [Planobispora rosea]
MAEIIKALIPPYKIERYLEGVVDVEDDEWHIRRLNATREIWADIGPSAIALNTGYCDEALIKYELWQGEPPASDWDERRSGSVHLVSGKIYAISCHSGEMTYGEEFDLGRRDHEWRFRAHRMFLSHEDFTTDIISLVLFKLQFWSPADAVRSSSEKEPTA